MAYHHSTPLTFSFLSIQSDVRKCMRGHVGHDIAGVPLRVHLHNQLRNRPLLFTEFRHFRFDLEVFSYHDTILIQNANSKILKKEPELIE